MQYIIGVCVILVGIVLGGCQEEVDTEAIIARHKKLAGELRDNGLYNAAISEYEQALASTALNDEQRANLNYLIGRICFEQTKDYERAAASYLKATSLNPEGSFTSEARRNLVASLEKIGNVVDARRQLSSATDIDAPAVPAQGQDDIAVARIGGVPIWLSQLDEELRSLPPKLQSQYSDPKAKASFMRQFVGQELLYHAALREKYDKDPEIQKKQRILQRRLLVDKYITDKVMPQIKIDTLDVINYYTANKADRYQNAPYDSVKAQVFIDYQMQKTQSAYTDYLSMLANKEKVEFYDQNVR